MIVFAWWVSSFDVIFERMTPAAIANELYYLVIRSIELDCLVD